MAGETIRRIPLFRVAMSKEVNAALDITLASGYIGQGAMVDQFEKALAERIGNPNVVTVSACTHALHLALLLAEVRKGDVVITTPLTCTATNWPILMCGADPFWAEIDEETGNIDPQNVKSILESGKEVATKVKAIMVVHWGGYPCDMDAISKIACEHNLPVIEDAAHAFGAEYKGRNIGAISDFTCFSFQAIKQLTSGDGGALFTLKLGHYIRSKLLRWYGIDRESPKREFRCEDDIAEFGYKYHMNDIAATIGFKNLKMFPEVLCGHRNNAKYYREALKDVSGVTLLREDENIKSSYWLFTMKVENQPQFVDMMRERGVMVSRVHERNDKHSCVSRFSKETLDSVYRFVSEMICIPVGWWVLKEDREYIVDCIKKGW